ncbi:hypothetical protein [Roseibium algae]|uniref:Uncharacterized protein n=1 Tax=Roseibium algae TaxID=3123038 RepID=A0ABU8TRZ4_9HYPH
MARFELETNYAEIQPIVMSSPNLTVAFDALVAANLLTITYAAFTRNWRKIKAEQDAKLAKKSKKPAAPRVRESRTRAAKQRPLAQEAQANAQTKAKTKPSQPIIGTFTHNPNSEGVGDKW